MREFLFRPLLSPVKINLNVWCLLLLSALFAVPGWAQTVLFQDDFNSGALDAGKWKAYDSSYFIHRTQMGKQPTFGSESGTGFVRLNLDTYNPDPTYGRNYVKGTEIFSDAVFPVGNGGIEYEARVRGTNVSPGLIMAFYSFGGRGTWPETYLWDEVDFEFPGNFPSNRLWLNIWDDYNPQRGGLNESMQPTVAALDWRTWNTFKIRVYPYVTQWLVNDVVVRQSYNITPADPMGVRFNLWAPDSSWAEAYNAAIAPATSTSNTTYFFDVDYVRVRSLPTGSIGNGTGLSATYYDNLNFSGATVSRTDPGVNFNWAGGSPAPAIGADTFSARWRGQVQAQFSETYSFTTRSDDGVRLWVNGQKIIDNWTDHAATEDSGSIALQAGVKYDIVLEYYDNGFDATVQLFWSSPSTPRRVVPQSQLFPASTVTPTATPTVTPTATPNGTGLSAVYYDNRDFSGPTLQRTDATVNFEWGDGSPAPAIGIDTFSTRWTGQVQPQFSELYTFYARADDGVRVWVNGQKLVDAWLDQGPTEYSGAIALQAGVKYAIVVEYYENNFGATVQLRWSSPSQPKVIVPQNRLFPGNVVTPPPTPTPTPGTGSGLSATYYDNRDFTGTTLTRVDSTINFDWGNGAPAGTMGVDTFSARWTGQVQPQFSETYTFTTRSDDGVRLWVNGQKIIDNWTVHAPTEDNGSIALAAGVKYDIRLEYYEEGFGAQLSLMWSSPSTSKNLIPQSQLYPQSTATAALRTSAAVLPGKPRPPATSTVLSSGVASTGRELIRLTFKVPLNADYATDAARYRVEVDGVRVTVESISYSAAGQWVNISLPAGTLQRGARVKVSWYNLREARGGTIANGVWQGVAS
jgi:hypothetical protein